MKTTIDHHATGQQLHSIRDQLVSLDLPYPTSHAVQRKLTKVIDAIDNPRSELTYQFAKASPADFDPRAYYPAPPS